MVELNSMRARASAALNSKPDASQAVEGLLEFSQQEFGLTGVRFEEVMEVINGSYDFVPTGYTSGAGTPEEVVNAAGQNSGSCKTFAFAKMHGLSQEPTLRLFCEHYQQVLGDPGGDSHLNIRAFIEHGWGGVQFDGEPLVEKGAGGAVDQV